MSKPTWWDTSGYSITSAFFYGCQGSHDYERVHCMSLRHGRIPYFQMESEMNRKTNIRRLTDQLGDADPVVREQSRNELIQSGGLDVTRALVTAPPAAYKALIALNEPLNVA